MSAGVTFSSDVALDTADVVEEYAIAIGDASTAVASVDRKPASLLAGELRTSLARDLKESSAWNDDGANLLRQVGVVMAQVVKSRRERRAKTKSDAERAELNRNLQRRLREATAETPEELVARFNRLQMQTMMGGEGTIAERIEQRHDLARREAIDQGRELAD